MFRVIYDSDRSFALSDESETVYVQGNNDTVQGGRGADAISAIVTGFSDLLADLSGGGGNDTLHVALTGEDDDVFASATANVDGGAGADTIEIQLLAGGTSATVQGGAGSDTIDIITGVGSDTGSSTNWIDGGAGNDTIIASAGAGYYTGGSNFARGGTGADTIELQAAESRTRNSTRRANTLRGAWSGRGYGR